MAKGKTYCFDIDGTITVETDGHDYRHRTPRFDIIERIRELYDNGNTIMFYSSRYSVDMEDTLDWMRKYDVPFSQVVLGKPRWDAYIGDEAFNVEWLANYENNL